MTVSRNNRFDLTYFCLDWEKLSRSPDHATIVRLMIALNDANCFPFLFSLTEQSLSEHAELDHYIAGINSYLQRLRVCHIAEAIKNTIRKLKDKEAESPRGAIWQLIKASRLKQFRVLENYLPKRGNVAEGKYYKYIEPYINLRHKITFHYDHQPSRQVIDSTIQRHIKEVKRFDKKNPVRGLIVDGCGADGQIGTFLRFLAADDLIHTLWRDELGVPLRRSYASCRKSKVAERHVLRFMGSFHLFAWELILEYLKKYDLLLSMKEKANRMLVDKQ